MLMRIKTKVQIVIFFILRDQTCSRGLDGCSGWIFLIFRERESAFSLDFRPIGPSVLDGARSKVALRGEGYAWAPIWWSSDNSKR